MGKTQGKCEECGKSIEFYPSARRRFCSGHCKAVAQHRRLKAVGLQLVGKKPRKGDEHACAMCKRTFYRPPAQIERGREFCSVRCADGAKVVGESVKQCACCGTAMRLKPSQAMRIYCSNACKGVALTLRPLDRLHNGKQARKDDAGYVLVWEPDHPNQSQRGWQYEHRLIAERALGRYLSSEEHVHHKNGVKDDNRPENLEVMAALDHVILSGQEFRAQREREKAELEEYRRRFGALG